MITISGKNICINGVKTILKGVAIPENRWLSEKENQNPLQVISQVKRLGSNCIRITIVPGHYQVFENYLETDIRPLVDEARKQGLICILDWHALGNPLTGQTKLEEYSHGDIYWYDASFELAKRAWKDIIEKFHKEPHVLYELFNEPAPGEKAVPQLQLDALPWSKWKLLQQELIDVIREKTSSPIIVNSNYWTFNLKETSKDLYIDDQIIYAFHCYPIRQNIDWREMLESIKNRPIIITEWGFDEKKESFYHGDIDSYAKPLLDYCKENAVSWIAWCFSASWTPRLLQKDWKSLTKFGEYVVKRINENA